MKNLLLSTVAMSAFVGSAIAADLPVRRAPPPAFVAVPVFTWTGFYAGVNAGYVTNDDARTTTTGNNGNGVTAGTLFNTNADIRRNSLKQKSDGFTGGGQVGYNYQVGRVILGLEADLAYTDLDSTRTVTGSRAAAAGFAASTYQTRMDYLGTVRGRIGYAIMDTMMVYATGGLAYGDVSNRQLFYAPSAGQGALQFAGSRSEVMTGYAVGGGMEFALPSGMLGTPTLKLEALYYDLGKQSVLVSAVGGGATLGTSYTSRSENNGVVARAGLNWKFNMF